MTRHGTAASPCAGLLALACAMFLEPCRAAAQVTGLDPIVGDPFVRARQPPELRPPPLRPPPTTPDDGICHPCADPPNVNSPPPSPLACYHLRDGLDDGSDCDWVAIPVVAGKRYRMSFCPASQGSANADMELRLFDSACNLLTVSDDACGVLSQITWDAGIDDTWRLQIANAQPSYAFATIYDLCVIELGDACDSCAVPGPIELFPTVNCQYQRGSTGPTEECNTDYYRAFLEAGAFYRFSLCPAPAPSPPDPTCPGHAKQLAGTCNAAADWNPRIEIFGMPTTCTAGTELTSGAQGNAGCSMVNNNIPDFVFSPPAVPGTSFYLLSIGRENPAATPALCSNHGTYTLAYQRASAGCATCVTGPYVNGAAPLAPTPACQELDGVIDSCNDEWLELDLVAGITYEFTTCNIPGGCGGAAAAVTTLALYDAPACSLLGATGLGDACSATGVKLVYTPLASGTFRLRVWGVAGQVGTYTLTYREAP